MTTAAIKVYEQTTETEVKLVGEAKEILAEAKVMQVETREQMSLATDVVKLIGTMKKEAEKDRTSLTGPLNSVLKNINERFKKISVPLDEADRLLRQKITIFQSAESRRIQKEEEAKKKAAEDQALRDAEKLRKKGNEAAAQEMEQHADNISNTVIEAPRQIIAGGATGAKSTLTKRWKSRVINIQALAAARPDLVLPNMVEINRVIAEGAREIPGLEIYQEESVSIR